MHHLFFQCPWWAWHSAVLPVHCQALVKLTGEFLCAQAPTETSVFFTQNLWSGILAPRVNSVQFDRNCTRKPGTKTRKERGSSDGELVSASPGQVMVMSWRTWHRTAKPLDPHTRRNRRLVVILGKDKHFLNDTKVTLHGTDSMDSGNQLPSRPMFLKHS